VIVVWSTLTDRAVADVDRSAIIAGRERRKDLGDDVAGSVGQVVPGEPQ
jgi:hypothetical protein